MTTTKNLKLFSISLFLFFFSTTQALAFCTWGFVPPEREYEPLNATEAFISYDNGVQTLVLKPEWQGNASDFGIVYPTPSKPEVTAGPVDIFWQLEEATNPWITPEVMFMEDAAMGASFDEAEKTVTVVEEKQVGEYDVTVLTATDADDLVEWLEDNDYNYKDSDAEKVEYYVEEGGFYFVALKVNADHFQPFPRPVPIEPVWFEDEVVGEEIAKVSMPVDWFWGELSNIQISFETDQPQLPMRTLKSNMPNMTFDLYTLSDKALYVPGVDTIWSNLVDAEFLKQVPSLNDYDPKAKWLLRQEINFDPSKSDADLFLRQVSTDTFTTVTAGTQVRFDPSHLDLDTGIIPGTRGQVVRTDGSGNAFTFNRSLSIGSVGNDVLELQRILNDEGFTVSTDGAGSPGNETTYFGDRTKQALIKYQNFYRSDILTPVNLTQGTGYFGPSTIAFINR